MDRTQQLQCVYHFLQTAVQRPPSIYENALEVLNSRWDATNKEHDWETLGGTFQSPQVWSRELFTCWQWVSLFFMSHCYLLHRKLLEKLLGWSAQIPGQHVPAGLYLGENNEHSVTCSISSSHCHKTINSLFDTLCFQRDPHTYSDPLQGSKIVWWYIQD